MAGFLEMNTGSTSNGQSALAQGVRRTLDELTEDDWKLLRSLVTTRARVGLAIALLVKLGDEEPEAAKEFTDEIERRAPATAAEKSAAVSDIARRIVRDSMR